MAATAPRVDVTLQTQDGQAFSSWDSFSISDDYTDPLGQMEFTVRPPTAKTMAYRESLKKGELVGVKVDGKPHASVLIQSRTERVSPDGGYEVTVHCKTPLATLYEANAPRGYSFFSQTDATVLDVVADIVGPFGFGEVYSDERNNREVITGKAIGGQGAKLAIDKLKHTDAQVQQGEKAYAFLSRMLTRLGVVLRCAHDGSLMVSVPNYDQAPSYLLTMGPETTAPKGGDRFFGSVEIADSNEDQFSECTIHGDRPDRKGDKRTQAPAMKVTASELSPLRPAYSSTFAAYKPMAIIDKNARDVERCRSVAKLAMGLRAVKAFSVRGTVAGLVAKSGAVWSVDTVATVHLATPGGILLAEDMWVLERTLKQSRGGGQETSLTLIPKGALVLGDLPS